MATPIKPGDHSFSSQPKIKAHEPLNKITGAAMGPIESSSKRSKLEQENKNYDMYNLYDPSLKKHSDNFESLFKSLTERTRNEILNQFSDEDFCEVGNRFPSKATGTRCIRKTHIGESSEVPNRVHANHVKLIDECQSIICSQAPTRDMEEAFWVQIIHHSSLVVDLTNDRDKNMHGVHEYFPDEQMGLLLGSVHVDVESTDPKLGEVKYRAGLRGKGTKEVERLHFSDWPDTGVINLEKLEKLLDRIEKKQAKSPKESLWIHCRAGVGRTGTVTVALALRHLHRAGSLKSENYLDVINDLILKGRAQRDVFFVQSKEQYQLLLQYAEKLLG